MSYKKYTFIVLFSSLLFAGCEDTSSGVRPEQPGQPSFSASCGNGSIEADEVCDDGNAEDNDGCASDCKTIEDGYECPEEGEACTPTTPHVEPGNPDTTLCGNGTIDNDEACDDGNKTDDDGCSADCRIIEDNYICPTPGRLCIPAKCGDGTPDNNEECDFGDLTTPYGKGMCTDECKWAHYCGDGKLDEIDIQSGEECDKGEENHVSPNATTIPYNSCSTLCKRLNYCGDGKLTQEEQCDDGDSIDNDGCSSKCELEPGFSCKTVEGKTTCTPINCGNGKVEPVFNEICDDNNRTPGDGCSPTCMVEAGYRCEENNEGLSVCTTTCGDGKLDVDTGEKCDDNNRIDGDGCSSNCLIEAGYYCENPAETSTTTTEYSKCYARACGDGILAGNEECDDGNTKNLDGCNKFCKREEGYNCPQAGKPCVQDVCPDGNVTGDETCDEGIDEANHTEGCINCQIQMGWECLTPGAKCTQTATCGDGTLQGAEECDEGSDPSDGGCVDCIITTGWRCPTVGQKCIQGQPGDGKIDKGEECDDGNDVAGDGCSPIGEIEPIYDCNEFGCQPTCGDGLVIPDLEECDDGNLVNGDGCSSNCKTETGFTCTVKTSGTPDTLDLPIVYHDFKRYNSARFDNEGGRVKEKQPDANGNYPDGYLSQKLYDSLPPHCKPDGEGHSYRHSDDHALKGWHEGQILKVGRPDPDFLSYCPGINCPKAVLPKLGKDGTPDLASYEVIKANHSSAGDENSHCAYQFTCPEVFKWWYNDVPTMNKRFDKTMRFTKIQGTTNDYVYDAGGSFLPITAEEAASFSDDPEDKKKRGEFTSHFQTYFRFKGGEQLEFAGDDDVWVFFNGYLGVDVGGIHGSQSRTVTLKDGKLSADEKKMYENNIYVVDANKDLHMFKDGIYAIDMFHAERCLGGSNYKMTLRGFVSMGQSTCDSICGDGLIRGEEECDPINWIGETDPEKQAELKEQAKFAGCSDSCKLQSYCGNNKIESGEQCDTKDVDSNGEPWCVNCILTDSTCGDGTLEGHEQCEPAIPLPNGQICLNTCRISGCGDGFVNIAAGEECDDNNTVNEDNCTNECKRPICGDGIVQTWLGEVCDKVLPDGTPKNDGTYGNCGIGCAYVPPYCGDGALDTLHEECDDGVNSGAYNTCNPDCTLPARCGDGITQSEFGETCDEGENNGTAVCTSDCTKPMA